MSKFTKLRKNILIGLTTVFIGVGVFTSSHELSTSTTGLPTLEASTLTTASAAATKIKKTSNTGKTYRVTTTAYTPNCAGCSGRSASGISLKNRTYYKGYRIIAADRKKFPIGTVLQLSGIGKAVVLDTGGAMHGNILDVLFQSRTNALKYGRKHNIKVKVLGKINI